jgi:hypothetical protein
MDDAVSLRIARVKSAKGASPSRKLPLRSAAGLQRLVTVCSR